MRTNVNKKTPFILTFCFISLVYIVGIAVLDKQLSFDVLGVIQLRDVLSILALFLLSIFVRYVRWYFLIKSHGFDNCFIKGFFFYVSGFTYTATPGKVGEISRVIHYQSVGIPSYVVISSFIIERFFDLIVVLIMSFSLFVIFPGLQFIAFSILLLIGGVFVFSLNLRMSKKVCRKLLVIKNNRIARFSCLLYKVILNINRRLDLKMSFNCFALGVVAWTCTSFILIYLCGMFNIDIPYFQIFSVYPVAMLSGAVSFIPGGIGATEAVIVFILNQFDTPISIATTVALLVRFSTLWLAIFFGILCNFISSFYIVKSSR